MMNNKMIAVGLVVVGGLGLTGCGTQKLVSVRPDYDLGVPVPALPFAPKTVACPQTEQPINVDGVLDEAIWQQAAWSDAFVDIEGSLQPAPTQQTRCKMCWDENYFYIAAELMETDLWATLTERDSIIFHDNDFEVFIDPDRDNHHYCELEINALNTVWDLLLIKPYREGGPALHGWNIAGLKTAVSLQGTLNDPSDTDQGWRVEIAIPFAALKEITSTQMPPKPGDRWKINFSRVQWDLDQAPQHKHGYTKRLDPQTGKPLPEHNWVWSPQGLIAMHFPERWGIVEFRGLGDALAKPELTEADLVDEALMQAFYHLRNQQSDGIALRLLNPPPLPDGWSPMQIKALGYTFTVQTQNGKQLHSVNHEGQLHRSTLP